MAIRVQRPYGEAEFEFILARADVPVLAYSPSCTGSPTAPTAATHTTAPMRTSSRGRSIERSANFRATGRPLASPKCGER